MTALDMIKKAARTCGLISDAETPSAELTSNGLDMLNQILAQWRLESLMAYAAQRDTFDVAESVAQYTIGPEATWAMDERPDSIDGAMIIINELSRSLEIKSGFDLQETTVYNAIPEILYYNPTTPRGLVVLWPTPQSSGQITIITRRVLNAVQNVNDTIELVTGYDSLLRYALAIELALAYGIAPSEYMLYKMRQQKAIIKGNNKRVMTLEMDTCGSRANIYAGY